tara:strand:- start:456 stop:665 length:210 start_codon:yes stop_codon:yes gene_type:complete
MLLHEFYSDDDCSRGDLSYRKALVFKEPDGSYTVTMVQDAAIIEERNIQGHSEQYAEDCAENWVLGVIK